MSGRGRRGSLEACCLQGQGGCHIDIILTHRLLKDSNGALTQPPCLSKPAQTDGALSASIEQTSLEARGMQSMLKRSGARFMPHDIAAEVGIHKTASYLPRSFKSSASEI